MSSRSSYAKSKDRDDVSTTSSSKADDKEIVAVIMSGDHERLKEYLANNANKSRFSALVKARSSSGSPLMAEIVKSAKKNNDNKEGFLECVRVLSCLDAPLDLQDKNGRTACHWAVVLEQVDMLSELITLGAHVDIVDGDGLNPLHLAINRKSLQCVQLLCGMIPPQMKDCFDLCGKCPLFRAICCQATDIAECLLFAGSDPNGFGDDGRLLTVHAIERACSDILLLLIKHGASVAWQDGEEFSICHLASCQENPACIAVLCKALPVDVLNGKDQLGKTPLMYAAMMGLDKNVELLLGCKVDECARDVEGKSTLHYTASNMHSGCFTLLHSYNPELMVAKDAEGRTALHDVVASDNTVVLKALLNAGAQPDSTDNKGYTPLHLAVAYGSLESLIILLRMQLNVNVRDLCGATPLHYSTQLENNEPLDKMRLKALSLLLKVGANVEIMDVEGRQPLHWAVTTGNIIACQLLVDAGADANAGTKKEHLTALHLACSQGWLECVKFLTRTCKSNVNATDYTGCSALFYACATGKTDVVEYLLRCNANPNLVSKDGKCASHCAAAMATAACLRFLQSSSADLQARNNKGETPMHEAASSGNLGCLLFLIEAGCKLNVRSNEFATPLHYAVAESHKDVVDALLRRGAKVNCVVRTEDRSYVSPLDVALGNGDHDCISLLQRRGGRTGHTVAQNSASAIQAFWKQHRGHRKAMRSPIQPRVAAVSVNGKAKSDDQRTTKEAVTTTNPALANNDSTTTRERILQQVEQGRLECRLMQKLRAESMELLQKYKETIEDIDTLSRRRADYTN